MQALREFFARFTTRFDGKPLKQGEDLTNHLKEKLEGAIDTMRNLGIVAGAIQVKDFLVDGINRAREFVNEMVHVNRELEINAQRLGTSTRDLQVLGVAGSRYGVGLERVVDAVSTLQERMRDAVQDRNSDPAVQLRALGIQIPRTMAEMPDAITLFGQAADGIAGMTNQTDRVGASMTVFGDVGRELLPVLQQGSAGIAQYAEVLDRLGGGISEEAIEAARELAAAQADLDLSLLSVKSRILVALVPTIEIMTRALVEVSAWIGRNEDIVFALQVALGVLAVAVGVLAFNFFMLLLPVLLPIAVALGLIGGAATGLALLLRDLYRRVSSNRYAMVVVRLAALAMAAAFTFFLSNALLPLLVALLPLAIALGLVAAVIAAVVLVVQDLFVWLTGGTSVIGTFVEGLLAMAGISLEPLKREVRSLLDMLDFWGDDTPAEDSSPAEDSGPSLEERRRAAQEQRRSLDRTDRSRLRGRRLAEYDQARAALGREEESIRLAGETGVGGFLRSLRGEITQAAIASGTQEEMSRRARESVAGNRARVAASVAAAQERAVQVRQSNTFTLVGSPQENMREIQRVFRQQTDAAVEAHGT